MQMYPERSDSRLKSPPVFGKLVWPTSGTLKFWESFIPVVVGAVGMWESLLSDFQGLWEGWENSFIVFPCFP